jgi:hypothetical protein
MVASVAPAWTKFAPGEVRHQAYRDGRDDATNSREYWLEAFVHYGRTFDSYLFANLGALATLDFGRKAPGLKLQSQHVPGKTRGTIRYFPGLKWYVRCGNFGNENVISPC